MFVVQARNEVEVEVDVEGGKKVRAAPHWGSLSNFNFLLRPLQFFSPQH
jgi:hypothetical protein